MKVSIISYVYPFPDRGYNPGIERVVRNLAQALSQLDHDVNVLTTFRNGGQRKHEYDGEVEIHRIFDVRDLLGKFGSIFSADQLLINVSINKYENLIRSSDIVHAFTPIIRDLWCTPLISHYHHWDEPKSIKQYLYLPTAHRLWRSAFRNSDRVSAVSKYSARDIASRGVNKDKINVVYNGVDISRFNPIENGDVTGMSPYENTLLFVGPLSDRKGVRYLIKSMSKIIREHPNTGLLIVGGGDQSTLKDLAQEEGVLDSIRFEGFVPDSVLPDYYRCSDAFMFPSLKEGFGMVLLEAMATKTPVIASNTTAIPEVVGDAGILVPTKDHEALAKNAIRILRDKKLRDRLAEKGYQRVMKDFTWQKSAIRLSKIYNSMC